MKLVTEHWLLEIVGNRF